MKHARGAVIIAGGLLVICLAWIVALSERLSKIQQENLEFRAQNESVEIRRSESLSEKLVPPDSMHESERNELLRLRNEVSRLRRNTIESIAARVIEVHEKASSLERLGEGPRENENLFLPKGERPRARLGIGIRQTDATDLTSEQGVVVVQIQKGGPSENALEVGDIILGVDGVPARDTASFISCVKEKQPGLPVALAIYRGGQRMDVRLSPVAYPDPLADP